LEPYRAAMRALAEAGLAYPCTLTRKQIEAAASAPNETDKGEGGELRFDPALRPAGFERGRRARFDDEATNWRLAVEPGEIEVEDRVAGRHAIDVAREVGDFVVWTKRGCPSYQLAVVVDDARQGVTDVVRGRDLIPSAARQALLQRALGLATPRWWHVGLVRGEDGRRLAKRHGDTRLAGYRESGAPADRVVGLLAWWTGLTAEPEPMAAAEFAERLAVDSIVTRGRWADDVTFTREHERWLRG
ncbi:MAG: glutamate--tRNA ligase family protein, partial [Planctomycetota bacterium]